MTREQIIGRLTIWAAFHLDRLVIKVKVSHGRWYADTKAGWVLASIVKVDRD